MDIVDKERWYLERELRRELMYNTRDRLNVRVWQTKLKDILPVPMNHLFQGDKELHCREGPVLMEGEFMVGCPC